MARTRITEYKFSPGISYTSSVYPNAQALFEANINFMKTEVSAFVAAKTAEGLGSWNNYTYDADKCARDVGYVIDAYKKDLKYGGNEETTAVVTKYWDGDTPQVDGDRQPEIDTHTFLKGLISGNIFTQTAQSNPYQSAIPQVTTGSAPESGAATRTDTLADITINVITSGLTAMPAKVANGYSRIKVPQRVLEEDILLITNASKGEVIYNFNDVNKLAVCSLTTFERDKRLYQQTDYEHDEDFYNFLQNGEYVTDIALYYDTATHSSTDNVQIFIDKGEQQVRPFDFGTDAIERNRVANPLSMLDADFEYGLQPTKWQAIGMLRGYPSIYEVPGTDVTVSAITSDVSAGTSGIGQSKITVTTLGNHGFSIGTPVTVKGLEPSIDGSSRAEGSFIITAVPSDTTFEYYAKSKVGTNNPANLYTPYVQLRKGGFYTGANISESPTFTVVSNGSQGTFTLPIAVNTGSSRLPFYGSVPELGAPLDDVGSAFIPLGAQVTGVVGTGGNPEITLTVVNDAPAGSTTIDVSSTSGVLQNMAVDDDSDANFIQNIAGAQITLESGIGAQLTGDNQTYTQVEGTNVSPTGNGASFDVTNTNGTYACTGNQTGTGYAIGDYIIIDGGSLGGQSGVHDLEIRVTDSNTPGEVLNFAFSGTGFNGVATYNNLGGTTLGGLGTGAEFNVTKTSGTYTAEVFSPNASTDYRVNDRIKITGGFLGGADSTNDCIITVTDVDSFGNILTVTASGTATDANVNYPGVDFTTTGSGTGAGFSVSKVATVYSATVDAAGQNFQVNDTITILGTALGGTSPTNDLTLTVDAVDVNGAITTVSESGTGLNSQVYAQITQANQTNLVGSGAAFNISTASGSYTAVVATAGEGYGINDEILIPGTDLGGSSPANDCTLTVIAPLDSIDGVTDVNESGNAVPGSGSFTDVQGNNEEPNGNGASFDITRSAQVYTVAVNTPGSQYKIGNRILISGNDLGGNSPANDLIITADTVGTPNGDITATTEEGSGAPGSTLTVYSTVSMSESTTNPLQALSTVNFDALATISVSFGSPHGLVPGSTFIVSVDSDDGSNNHYLAAGSFIATSVSALDQISYQALSVGTINTGNNNDDAIQGTVYPRPDSFFVHRPFDGGVQLGTGSPVHGAQAIRQSKKYIRYQSGKGIMYTTGALFAPSYDLLQVTANGTSIGSTITCTTDDTDHGLQVGGGIRLIGINTVGFNGDYVVSDINSEREFEVLAINALGSTTPELSAKAQVSVKTFHGATVRSGCFDDQNGIFFEYDGTQFSAVQRTATLQLAGVVDIAVDTNTVTGTGTRFREQLKAGDRIVIKGMTHVVSDVISNTQMSVAPDFRGVTNVLSSKLCLVQDKKTEQKDFNRDRMDGTGPSGYNIDISKMQMVGIQYSWYGAGFIDYMLRGADGNFVFGHRMRNSNINTEAFMRTGNMPVRYEVTNEGPVGKLSANVTDTATTLPLEDASFFPPEGGIVYIDNEMIQFTGVDGKNLTGCTRGAQMTNFASGATRTYSAGTAETHTRNTGVPLISNTISPIISHWGSAYITDGGFDFDRGYLFSYKATGTSISTTRYTSFLIRLAPSVSNAIVGDLGERELLNRAQLLLDGLEVTSEPNAAGQKGGIVIEGVLNPQNYPVNPNDIGWEGISGLASGGQPSFAQIAAGGSVNWNGGATQTTASAVVQADIDSGFNYTRTSQYNDRYSPITIDYSPIQTIGTPLIGAYIESQNPTNAFNANQYVISGVGPLEGNGFRYRIFYTGPNGTNRASNLSTTSTTLKFIYKTYTGFTNKLLFTKASWEASGAGQGTEVASSDLNWPAGTFVQSVSSLTHCGTEFYEVTFNQTSVATISAGDSVTFLFGNPPYAQPGETIFSFIAQPGERATLNLAEIKELTNTTLGGRGTFPNGPDVLAINVYKTAGTAVDANIILRWSEAQA